MILLTLAFIIIILLLLLLFFERKKNTDLQVNMKKFEDIIENKMVNHNMLISNQVNQMAENIDMKLMKEGMKSSNSLENYMKKIDFEIQKQSHLSNESIKEIVQKVAVIEETKNQMNELSKHIDSLQDVFKDKKARGTFGEVQLNQIFIDTFGAKSNVFQIQETLSNGKIADLVLNAPSPVGKLCIDSKFPLENYLKVVNEKDEAKKETYSKMFIQDMKKHINDISSKYIIEGETSEQAIMFIPSEAIFLLIIQEYETIITYANSKKVWLTSPTTIMSILTVLQIVLKDVKRNENAKEIHTELLNLSKEFQRYETRWINLQKHFETVQKDLGEINITTGKIVKKFEKIERVEIDED